MCKHSLRSHWKANLREGAEIDFSLALATLASVSGVGVSVGVGGGVGVGVGYVGYIVGRTFARRVHARCK